MTHTAGGPLAHAILFHNMPSTTDEEDETSDSNSRQVFKKTLAAFSFQTPSPKTGSSTTPKRLHITNHTEPSSSNTTHSSETDIKPKQPRSIKSKRGFAPADRYSHLKPLQDYLQPNLDSTFYFPRLVFKSLLTEKISCILRNKVLLQPFFPIYFHFIH